jgi:glycosyltransferase involved in cell wall biosynthesis
VPALIGKKKSVITIVHDLIAFQNEPHDRKATFIERLTLHRAARVSEGVCTVSESTKKDLLKKYPDLSSQSVTPIFAGPVTTDSPENHPDHITILCIATLCPRKNQLRLIQAFAALPDDLRKKSRVILVGKRGWDDDAILALMASTPGVEWKNYIPDAECEALLHSATVFAFPSLYEGFGMPILDAFRHGIPVLTSDRGSLKEVAGDAAFLVDPEDTEALSQGLETLLRDAALRLNLSEKGKKQAETFSWKRTVDLFLQSVHR